MHAKAITTLNSERVLAATKQLTDSHIQRPKPILQQTKALRKELRTSISRNLTHENIYTVPNILTFSRLVATPVIGYLIIHDAHAWATGLLFYAGVTDLIDGWIARKWNQQTVVGTVIDPLADKALMAVLTVCLAVHGGLPGVYDSDAQSSHVDEQQLGLQHLYWAVMHPSQSLLSTIATLRCLHPSRSHAIGTSLCPAQRFTRLVFRNSIPFCSCCSGASYLWTRKAVKILGSDSEQRKRQILVRGRLIIGACFTSVGGLALWLES